MSNTQKINLIYGKLYCSSRDLFYSIEPSYYAFNRFLIKNNMPLIFLNYRFDNKYDLRKNHLFDFLYKEKMITFWFTNYDDYNCFEELE